MLIYLNKDWLFDICATDIPVIITLDEWKTISIVPEFKAWKYLPDTDEFILVDSMDLETLRARRIKQCFNIIDNKSKLWWDNLTAVQLNEIKTWYQNWLDVTATKVIPQTPSWL